MDDLCSDYVGSIGSRVCTGAQEFGRKKGVCRILVIGLSVLREGVG